MAPDAAERIAIESDADRMLQPATLIDGRGLRPFRDTDALAGELAGIGDGVIVAHEDALSWGYGAELSARIADQLFHHLDAPVRRVAATDTFVAYQPLLENAILPQVADLYRAMKELAGY